MANVVSGLDSYINLTSYHYNMDSGWISFDVYLEDIPYEMNSVTAIKIYHGQWIDGQTVADNVEVNPWAVWHSSNLGWEGETNPTSASWMIENYNGSSATGLLGTASFHTHYFPNFNPSSPTSFFNDWSSSNKMSKC